VTETFIKIHQKRAALGPVTDSLTP